ncbi:sugar ABC transporter permease [Clostridia bacterium]|nr:sugar ABC transporter permease [Clostridia bacterium]
MKVAFLCKNAQIDRENTNRNCTTLTRYAILWLMVQIILMGGFEDMKTRNLVMLTLVVCFALFASGCGDKEVSVPTEEPLTLTYWSTISGGANTLQYVKSYAENTALIEVEKRTGVHIEWIHPAVGQENEQFNLLIASGQLPDIISNVEKYRGGSTVALRDGLFLDITKMIETNAPNLTRLIERNPILRKDLYSEDGVFLGFCQLSDDSYGTEASVSEETPYGGPMLRKDYLDELGLGIPETMDEWHKALTAIKETKKPSIVLSMPTSGVNELFGTFLSAFKIAPDFYQVDGIVKYGRIESGYKEYLTAMNQWYKEGLIDSEFAMRDQQSLNSLINSGQVAAVHQQSPSFISRLKGMNQLWTGASYPSLEKGVSNPWRYSATLATGWYTLISATSKHPKECIEFLDYGYSEEGLELLNFGVDGVDYNGLDEKGRPNYVESYVTAAGDSTEWTARRDAFRLHGGAFLHADKRSNPNRWVEDLERWRDVWGSAPSLYRLPSIRLTIEENTEASNVMADVVPYMNEMTTKFIMGVEPLTGFDDYVANIKKMGIDKSIAVRQNALERYNKQ